LIGDFEVGSMLDLDVRFANHFIEYGADKGDGVLIGTKAQIQQRQSCPSCNFTARLLATAAMLEYPALTSADFPDDAECFIKIHGQPSIAISMRSPDRSAFLSLVRWDQWLIFVARSLEGYSGCGRIIGPYIDYDRVKRWLSLCDSLHQDTCPMAEDLGLHTRVMPVRLRVIDVQHKCLADIEWTTRYAALSYVWGNVDPPNLYENDIPLLCQPGSLSSGCKAMPKMIQDAIDFTLAIGIQYLWIDCLCHVQDKPQDLQQGVMCMDMIYEGAYVTIIAANGHGAAEGLPGTVNTSREPKQLLQTLKPGLEVTINESLDDLLSRSLWASRGWT
jgi:hypothetical protein